MKRIRVIGFGVGFFAGIVILKFILFSSLQWQYAIAAALICGFVVSVLPFIDTLDTIKSSKVGDDQHGSADYASDKEKSKYFISVKDGDEEEPGFIVGRTSDGVMIDGSDTSTTVIAPPGGRKTTSIIEPSIIYNAKVNVKTKGKGASMLITDVKGGLRDNQCEYLKECGYLTPILDFSDTEHSQCFNILYNINKYIDGYLNASSERERITSYSKAERYAKILSESIVENVDGVQKNEAGQYFTETAKGLVTGISLLVSEYGNEEERHIISVFKLIVELNGLAEGATGDNQKSRLAQLLEYVDNERIKNYVGPAMSADMRSAMNIFSSALGKLVAFVDMELEQMICSHSQELNDIDFIKYPTAIFIVCPDENTTRHFFASLFIRYLMNDLIEQSRTTGGILSRKVLCFWDEFGNMPPIKNVDVLISAARSRGIRFLIALQSISQLENKYSQKMSEIILDSVQSTMFTYVSPMAYKTAEQFSKILGNQTVKSGSVTQGGTRNVSYQMISRALMFPDEIIRMLPCDFIILKGGQKPVKTHLPRWTEYYKVNIKKYVPAQENGIKEIKFLTIAKVMALASKPIEFTVGMFD